MSDRSQVIFSSRYDPHQPVRVEDLKEVDIAKLHREGLEQVYHFLSDLQSGLDQGKPQIELNIPFIKNENQAVNKYTFLTSIPDLSDTTIEIPLIHLADLLHLLDELSDWLTKEGFLENVQVKVALGGRKLPGSLLTQQQTVTEAWLYQPTQFDHFKQQLSPLLMIVQALASNSQEIEGSLEALVDTILKSDARSLLSLWQSASDGRLTVKSLLQAFNNLENGSLLLTDVPGIPVNEVRIVSNTYIEQIRQLITKIGNPFALSTVANDIQSISIPSVLFDTKDTSAGKRASEAVVIGQIIELLDRLVPALSRIDPEIWAEIGEKLLEQNNAEAQAQVSGGVDNIDYYQSSSETQSSAEVASTSPVDYSRTSQYGTLSSDIPLHEKNIYRYSTISQHAGFLYNHITSNLFSLYPDLPPEYRSLPPLEMYQLRQDIVQYLYQLSPQELSQLTLYGRFALGEELFRRLIIQDPKLFIRIEHYVQTVSQNLGIKVETPDPLHLEDRTAGFQHEKFIREIPQSTQTLQSLGEEGDSAAALQSATSRDVFNQSFHQNDEALKAGLASIGITELVPALRVRNVILSYIQTTGLDPATLMTGRTAANLSFMFGVTVPTDQVETFTLLVSSYWQYQLHKFQTVTRKKIVPNPALVEITSTDNIQDTDLNQIAAINWAEHNAAPDGNEIRLTILASLTTTADLEADTVQRRDLIQALSDLYQNDQVETEQALRRIMAIQRAQQQALAAEAAIAFNHHQFLAFQAQTIEDAEETEALAAVPTGPGAFNALTPFEKQQLLSSLMLGLDSTQDSPQELYAQLLDIQSQESQVIQSPGEAGGRSFLGRFRNGISGTANKVDQISKGISRIKTIGAGAKTLTETAATTAAASTNPVGTAFGKTVGAGARALFGDKVGGTIEKAAMAIGSVGGVLSAIGTAITAATTFLTATAIPALWAALTFIGPGAFIAAGAAVGGLFAAGASVLNSTIIKPFMGGGASGAASGTSAASSPFAGMQPGSVGYGAGAPPGGSAAVATSTTAAPMTIGSVAPLVSLVGTAGATAVLAITTHGAFLANLPTIGDKDISPYVVIEKVATPGTKFDTPTDVTYTIRIRAKDGFKIQLTEAPTDEFSVTFSDRETDTTPRTPTDVVPTSPDHEAFKTALTTFHTDNPIITTEPITVGTYTIPFGSNPGEIDYTDANVRNIFSIKFNVLDVNGQPITDPNGNTVASTGEVICFGDCPQSQGGCWPTSGIINQLPYGHDSHGPAKFNSDAYDIGAPAGTPVYAPFEGEACEGNVDSVNYGNHVILKVSNATYSSSGGGTSTADMHLMFAHLSSISSTLENSCQTVTPGFVLGEVGSTGNSTGPHLHYEAWFGPIASVNKKEPSLLMQYVPELVKLRDPVRSCYD